MKDNSIQDIYQIKKLKNKKEVDEEILDNYIVFNRELAEERFFPIPTKKEVLSRPLFDKKKWVYTKRKTNDLPKLTTGGRKQSNKTRRK